MTDSAKYRSYSQVEEFLLNFYKLRQNARIYSDNHRLVIKGIEKFSESINNCVENESLTLKISNDQLFIDDEKIPYNRTTKNLFDNIIRYFDTRGLEGVRFLEAVKHVSGEEILAFLRLLEHFGQKPEPLTWLTNCLAAQNINWVELIKKSEIPQADREPFSKDKTERWERARKDYTYAKASLEEVVQKIKDKKGVVGIGKTVRIVQDMVTNIIEDDEVYAAISTLRVFDDYTFTHSVNVAMLSLCLGRRINLSRRTLASLGICALFHDLGKIEIPKEVLHKKDKLDDRELKLIEEHSLNSARLLLKLKASPDSKARILVPLFEHHLKYDLSGYPRAEWKKPLTLFGKIISIADKYDTLTSSRAYKKSLLSPDRALGYMLDHAGKDFDPILIKVFINILGVYPVGTLLRLDTDELALVVSSPSRNFSKRPLVCVLEKEGEGSYKKREIINLDERDTETGNYAREIIETYHPATFGIQPVQHMFSGN
ncbi:MAG TPA: HD domain-containing phosphohydrolase [Desulfobulbales bacterium]|nr:HD domain-containing phosphohydrolase [Desulfobulbales bacterium]